MKEYWIFTFGYGQPNEGHYVKIYGSYDEARQKMFAKYGANWAFQYSSTYWEDWKKRRPPYVPLEKELEVIGGEE